MDKVQEDFEKEYLASMNPHFFENEEQKKVYLKTNSDGNYVHDCTRLAYLWFVKGREAIVVKIPKVTELNVLFDYDDIVKMLEEAEVHYE